MMEGVSSAQFSSTSVAQMRLNPDGELETLKAADWLALRERLRANASADTPYLRILHKYVRD